MKHDYPSLRIKYMTVHKSKGLEADFVIVAGLKADRMGFPSQIEDDPLLRLVLLRPEAFPFAEERRLFYVALTRARDAIYLLVDAQRASVFADELRQHDDRVEVLGVAAADGFCPNVSRV